jgi:hypothetical protein
MAQQDGASMSDHMDLVFEMRYPDGKVVRIYSNGLVEGVPEGTVVINRLLFLMCSVLQPLISSDPARGNQSPCAWVKYDPSRSPQQGKSNSDTSSLECPALPKFQSP